VSPFPCLDQSLIDLQAAGSGIPEIKTILSGESFYEPIEVIFDIEQAL